MNPSGNTSIFLYCQNTLKFNTGLLTAFLLIALLWYRNRWAKVETSCDESQGNHQGRLAFVPSLLVSRGGCDVIKMAA